ncbi:Acyl-protein thioesterase 1 [Hypsizygus marmoreus]|uniref:Acyl-protein thioesterase 1 n=1 Tax=Hypsizygus marmoreus TaxID=39966 RepID=A0A369K5Z2_HYPMA|nr:Acyl-protein thioesterase 1 [Hypsizygus marmoreus]
MDREPSFHNVVTIPARQTQTATIIFIHGLGQSNVTWRMVAAEALSPSLPHVQWLFPQASKRPVSMNQGLRRPSWFDIARLPPSPNEFDEYAISESIGLIEDLILSQGAALSMMVALTSLHDLGGVVSLSGWIPPRARHMIHATPTFPILWCHGIADREIPFTYGQEAIAFLRNTLRLPQSRLQLRAYDGLDHAINDAELNDVAYWLQCVLSG